MQKAAVLIAVVALLTTSWVVWAQKPTNSNKGFNEFGYNYTARNFVGTGGSWCAAKGFGSQCEHYPPSQAYVNDKLVMKWNAEWDRGNSESWSNPPYDAWENNEWNGAVPNGSGEVWHYKIKWVGPKLQNSDYWSKGGTPIWGQFEILMDQGTADGKHFWYTHATPAGYGSN